MSKKAKVALAIAIVLLAFGAWFGVNLYSNIPESPELALKEFYEREVAEDQIMDPLIVAGRNVVPLLEKEVTNPNMPNRRYAIGALGNLGSKSALTVLENLAKMKSEVGYIRCDALVAIGMIDQQEGLRVANVVKGEGLECLSDIANNLDGNYAQWLEMSAPKRTYFQALLGRHS
jgi:hypothetical protein